MPVTTAQSLIIRAMKECGATGVGEVPEGAEIQEGFDVLNGMVGALQTESLVAHVIEEATEALTANVASYTIGTGGDFDRFRPNDIYTASYIDTTQNDLEVPIRIVNYQEWQVLPQKNITSPYPMYLYYVRSNPLGVIHLYPVPTVSFISLKLYLPTPLAEFAALTTQYNLPPGFEEMLVYNLALRFCSKYRLPVDQQLERWARESRGMVKRSNLTVEQLMSTDPELNEGRRGAFFDWYTGEPM